MALAAMRRVRLVGIIVSVSVRVDFLLVEPDFGQSKTMSLEDVFELGRGVCCCLNIYTF